MSDSSARAQHEPAAVDGAGDTDSAYDAALDRALAAHEAGDHASAEIAMREALALSRNARTLRGLGVILYAQGRYLEAIAPLEAAQTHQVKPLSPALRTGVDALLERIWQEVGRLTVRVAPAEAALTVDGEAPVRHGPEEIVLAPGQHSLRITAPGRDPYEVSLRTPAGSRDSIHVVLAEPARAKAPALAPVSGLAGPVQAPRKDHAWTPLLRNSLLISGAAIALTGAALWITSYVRFRQLEQWCLDMPNGACTELPEQEYEEKRIEPLNRAGIALAGTGAALLLAVAGVELWQWRQRARLQVAGSGLALRLQF